MVKAVTSACDSDNSGYVDKDEFLAAAEDLVEIALSVLEDKDIVMSHGSVVRLPRRNSCAGLDDMTPS